MFRLTLGVLLKAEEFKPIFRILKNRCGSADPIRIGCFFKNTDD